MPNFRVSILRILVLLIVVHAAWANLTVVGDRLSLDALVRTSAYWWRAEQAGLAQNESAIERVEALAGLTGRLSSVVSFRLSGDVSFIQPQDLYVDLRWQNGVGLRAGQFLLPLGFDAMTEPDSQVLTSTSFLVSYAKPDGTRDIGAMGSWQINRFSASAAVVNGSGSNVDDNNNRKDLCGRISLRPLARLDAVVALRAYYGWPNAADSVWRSVALEAHMRHGPVTLQAELQNHLGPSARNNMAYLQALWDFGLVECVGRFDLDLPQRERTHWMIDGGVSLRPLTDHFKVMLDCSYNRDYQGNWAVFGFSFRLQAGL